MSSLLTASPTRQYQDERLTLERKHPTSFTVTVSATTQEPWSFDIAAPNLTLAQSDAAWRLRDLADVPGLLITVTAKSETREPVAA